MPVMVNGAAVLVNTILPLVLLVALKLVKTLLLPKVVPPTDTVVNAAPPLINPVLVSVISAPAVKLVVPLVVKLPALILIERPAFNVKVPDVLLLFEFN